MSGSLPAGWYPDPEGRAPARWWDGLWWTAWESDHSRQWVGSPPGPSRRPGPQDLPTLDFVRTAFIPEARRRGALDEHQAAELAMLTDQLAAEVLGPRAAPTVVRTPPERPVDEPRPSHFAHLPKAPPVRESAPAPATPTVGAPAPAPTVAPQHAGSGQQAWSPQHGWSPQQAVAPEQPLAPQPAGPPPRPETRAARWGRTSRLRLDTDLTVHGLTYLGVLLLFVGVFGLVAFAFGDVAPGLRPVAEIAVAAVPFTAAWLLARSGARFVARAMIAVGGLILPVMVVTSTVDGYHLPPDLRGLALPVGTGLACAALAVAYAARSWRRPSSALGVMVAPTAWFAAGMGAVALARPVPSGEDVAVPGAAQVGVIALAVLATTWGARRLVSGAPPDSLDPRHVLARGALGAVPAGLVVTAVLALVAWTAEGWPLVPVVVTTMTLAGTAALVRPSRSGDALVAAWLVVVLRLLLVDRSTPVLSEHLSMPGAALDARPALLVAALLAGAGALELLSRRLRVTAVAFGVLGWTLTIIIVPVVLEPPGPWWSLAGAAALSVWAPVRRTSPPPLVGARVTLDALAVVAPVAVVLGVWQHVGAPAAGVLAGLLALGVTPLARGRLSRGPTDRLWYQWWAGAVTVTLVASVALATGGLLGSASHLERAAVPTMLLLVVTALVAGLGRRPLTVALATPVTWLLWVTVVEVAPWGEAAISLGFATLGLSAVGVAHLRGRTTDRAALALAVAGFVTGAGAVRASVDPATAATALGLGTLAWLLTALLGDRERSPVGAELDRFGRMRALPWVAALLGLTASIATIADATGTVRISSPWWASSLIAVALGSAAATRGRPPARLRPALAWVALVLAVLAVLAALTAHPPSAARGSWPTVAAVATLVLVAPLARERHAVLAWVGWLSTAPLAGLVAWTGSAGARDLGADTVTAGALVGVGGLLAVGALLVDRAVPWRPVPWRPRALPQRPTAVPPFLVGSAQLALGAFVAAALPHTIVLAGSRPAGSTASGILLAAVAALTGAIAGLGGIGTVGAAAAILAWFSGRVLLAEAYPGAWADTSVVAALLVVALLASLVRVPVVRWARWDVPLSVAASLPALVALASAGTDERSGVYVVIGGLAVAAAVRLARLRTVSELLATIGSVLVLVGAAWAGRGWVVGTLVGLAVAHSALAALRESGSWRTARQWVGALMATAAWVVFALGPTAFDGNDQARLDVTAVGAAFVTLGVVAAAVTGRLDRSWSTPWGVLAALLAVGAGLVPQLPLPAVGVSWWQVVAWALLTVATVLVGQLSPRQEDSSRQWRSAWQVAAVAPALGVLLAGLAAASATTLARVTVLTGVSLATALVVVAAARVGRRALELPLVVLGAATLAVAAIVALDAEGAVRQPVLLAVVLAAAAVQAGAYGVALRILGLRLAAPVLAWLAWALYATDALGGVVFWHTVPVGIAMIAVAEVWRADRRRRGLPTGEPAVASLDLAGISFLVVASFVAAFTHAVWHALVAAGIGVLVFGWALLTRVRRRLFAGATIVLAGVVIAAVLPLVALVPAWGGPALWIAVALAGLLVVLVATFLERGRAAVSDGRARLRAATQGWE